MKINMNNLQNINNFGSVDASQIYNLLATYGLVTLIISIFVIVELWIIFKKCGKKGWLALIPIANLWTLLTIVDLPGWLSLIPVANFVGLIVAYFKLPVKFGKSAAFGLGIMFFPYIFLGLLAFSKEKEVKEEIPAMVDSIPEQNSIAKEISSYSNEEIPANNQNEPVLDLAATNIEEQTNMIDNNESNNLLNIEEPIITNPESVAETLNESSIQEVEAPSAFEMTPPVQDNQEVKDIVATETLDTLPETNNEVVIENPNINIDSPLNTNDDIPNIFDIPNEPIVKDNKPLTEEELEATFELPKMANEIINSDIKETKTCPNCGHINEYPNKTCTLCGTPLE